MKLNVVSIRDQDQFNSVMLSSGLSLYSLAIKSKLSYLTVHQAVLKRKKIRFSTAYKISKVLGENVDQLFIKEE